MAAVSGVDPIVIVGGGQAGGVAAVTLREEGFGGRVVLLGDESTIPFGRPPLSKGYLRGTESLRGWYVKPRRWYDRHGVERLVGVRAVRVDTAGKQVVLESGQTIGYGKVLLATGGRNRRLDVPGVELPGIYSLRTVAECAAIKEAAQPGRHAVVVGMGFIGSEVAASLATMGLRVTAIFDGPAPLRRVLGEEVGRALASIHREHGVTLLPNDRVAAFEGADRLHAVVTARGRRLPCDLAVVGVGLMPNVEMASESGIATDNGILVDEYCRTSVPDVYAAGDVANHLHPLFGRIRVEHYNNAEKHGRAAAQSMLGRGEPYAYIHSFWSDQYDDKIEYIGHAAAWDQFIVRGSLEQRQLVGFYLKGGALLAAVGLNRGGDPELEPDSELAAVAALLAEKARPAAEMLADEGVDLRSLAG